MVALRRMLPVLACCCIALLAPHRLFADDSGPRLVVKRDRFDGSATVTIAGPSSIAGAIYVAGLVRRAAEETVYISPGYIVMPDSSGSFYLAVVVNLEGWAFLSGSVEFLLDGQPMHISSREQPDREVRERGDVYESFLVYVSEAAIQAIASSKMVELRMAGERRSLVEKLGPANLAEFRMILGAPEFLAVDDAAQKRSKVSGASLKTKIDSLMRARSSGTAVVK